MNRNEEYAALRLEPATLPDALETTVDRALARESAFQRRRLFGIPAASLAACFAAFILLVNLFPPFAAACESVPVLRELAQAVDFSPSLSAAVENDYVQPIGQSRTSGGITATVEYVIVDQKQVNVFFTLNSDAYENLSIEMPQVSPEQCCSIVSSDFRSPPGTLQHFTLDYYDQDVPERLSVTFGVTTYQERSEPAPAPEVSYEDELLSPDAQEEPEILATFTFDLSFDPHFTVQGERIPVGATFTLDDQTLTLTEAEVYPTHVRVNFTADEANTAWLVGLEFYLENERGERFDSISNGISASGEENSPMMVSYRLESPYFADSQRLTLHITGAKWLDKDRERARIDLVKQTAEGLPDDVALRHAERREGGWILTFSVRQYEENRYHQTFGFTYYDESGNEYELGRSASEMGERGDGGLPAVTIMLPLPGYDQDVVYLSSLYTRVTEETLPVAIPIK